MPRPSYYSIRYGYIRYGYIMAIYLKIHPLRTYCCACYNRGPEEIKDNKTDRTSGKDDYLGYLLPLESRMKQWTDKQQNTLHGKCRVSAENWYTWQFLLTRWQVRLVDYKGLASRQFL